MLDYAHYFDFEVWCRIKQGYKNNSNFCCDCFLWPSPNLFSFLLLFIFSRWIKPEGTQIGRSIHLPLILPLNTLVLIWIKYQAKSLNCPPQSWMHLGQQNYCMHLWKGSFLVDRFKKDVLSCCLVWFFSGTEILHFYDWRCLLLYRRNHSTLQKCLQAVLSKQKVNNFRFQKYIVHYFG